MFSKNRGTTDLLDKVSSASGLFGGRTKSQRSSLRRPFMVGIAAGAAGMFILDPRTGRRRRALVRDKVVRLGHAVDDAVTETVPKKLQYMSGFAQGLGMRSSAGANGGAHASDDDKTVTDRVMSTVFRDLAVEPGELNVNTVDHVVYLRGLHEDQKIVDEIERRTRQVPGVRDVINLINRPDVDPSTLRPDMDAQAG